MIKIARVLVPTDFSKSSENALRYGCELADKFGAELHLLYALEDATPMFADPELAMVPLGEIVVEQERHAQDQLDKQPPEDWAGKIPITRVVKQGTAFVEIVRYAKQQDVDIIVLGTHGRSGLAHVLLGSVAEKVVRKAPCPVLTVRDSEHEFIHP